MIKKNVLFLFFLSLLFTGCSVKTNDSIESQIQTESNKDSAYSQQEQAEPEEKNTINPLFEPQYSIFPNSSTELLTQADLFLRDSFTLKLAKNEIFARKGYLFKNPSLQNYFENIPWYQPNEAVQGIMEELNEIEKQNVNLIQTYSLNQIDTSYYSNFKAKENELKKSMTIEKNLYNLSYEEITRHDCPCIRESLKIDLNYDGFMEELTVYFYSDSGDFYSYEIEITDIDGNHYATAYNAINPYPYINIADFDVRDGLIQFYISEGGPSYDPCVQIFSFDGKKIIQNTEMIGFITSYDGMSKIYSFDEYSVNCYYDLNNGLTPLPKESIIHTTIEAPCNIELFDEPFTGTTDVITSPFLTEETYEYQGQYSENYMGILPKGTPLSVLDILFQKENDHYSNIPWIRVETPSGQTGWFHLYYGD